MPTRLRQAALLENHIAFIERHRGSVRRDVSGLFFEGETPGLTSFCPSGPDFDIPPACRAVRLFPWSGASESRLSGAGFSAGETLSYMELGDCSAVVAGAEQADLRVYAASSTAEAAVFAHVQTDGFLVRGEADFDWWRAQFERMAAANYRDPDQRFLIAYVAGQPAGVLLTLRAAGVTGIYAVTTRPQFRRLGVSSALLSHAVRHETGARFILQANEGSAAEAFYARRGFECLFKSTVWRR